jgi:hypothetical protein
LANIEVAKEILKRHSLIIMKPLMQSEEKARISVAEEY